MNVKQQAFRPVPNATVNLTATTATGDVQIQTGNTSDHVRIVNTGAVTVFVEFGNASTTASTTTSMPVVAGATEIFFCRSLFVAAITASGTAVIYATPGEGL